MNVFTRLNTANEKQEDEVDIFEMKKTVNIRLLSRFSRCRFRPYWITIFHNKRLFCCQPFLFQKETCLRQKEKYGKYENVISYVQNLFVMIIWLDQLLEWKQNHGRERDKVKSTGDHFTKGSFNIKRFLCLDLNTIRMFIVFLGSSVKRTRLSDAFIRWKTMELIRHDQFWSRADRPIVRWWFPVCSNMIVRVWVKQKRNGHSIANRWSDKVWTRVRTSWIDLVLKRWCTSTRKLSSF